MAVPAVITTTDELRSYLAAIRSQGKRIGFVPTMGALHAGHLSLVEASNAKCDTTVVSIFVNPTQFGPQEDFSRYPRDLAGDLAKLADHNVECVFAPSDEEMYPEGYQTYVEVLDVSSQWEGAHRPGHFRGVTTVVAKLFNQVMPDIAFFGQKDYQQTVVLRRMVRDLAMPVQIEVCPTVREPDGLALSSRNAYLSPEERKQALAISAGLKEAAELVAKGENDAAVLIDAVRNRCQREPDLRLQYVAIVDPDTLQSVAKVLTPAVALVAAYVGTTRLIDNWRLEPS
jgi:pantoate--beta-alanine ligase